MWLLRNALCLPCVFGRVAQVGADYSSSTCCCVGFMVGAAGGGYFFGAPIFPCAMQVRPTTEITTTATITATHITLP